jgi:hypothetical protein
LRPENDFHEDYQRIIDTIDAPNREAPPETYLSGGIIVGDGLGNPRIVVLGDSHGVMWSDPIRIIAEKRGIKTSFYSMNGVSPFIKLPLSREQHINFLSPEEKYHYDKARLDFIRAWKPELVIVCAKWSSISESDAADLLEFLEDHASKVLLMEQPPELDFGNRNALQVVCSRKIKPEPGVKKYLPIEEDKWEKSHAMLLTLAGKYRNCDYIPTRDLFVQDSQGLILDGKSVVYVDDDHLTTHGARLALPRIEQEISKVFDARGSGPEKALQIAEGDESPSAKRRE